MLPLKHPATNERVKKHRAKLKELDQEIKEVERQLSRSRRNRQRLQS